MASEVSTAASPSTAVCRQDAGWEDRELAGRTESSQAPTSFFVVERVDDEVVELERGPAREPFLAEGQEERTGFWTHYACHLVRVTFLFSHGLLVITVSSALSNLGEASWFLLFTAAWVGDFLCMGLLVYSWFASCPYIKRCRNEGKVKIGIYPSFLTEVLPEIVLSVLGLIFMIFVAIAEYLVCSYLDSVQQGKPKHVISSIVFLCIVAFLTTCHGTLLTHNSALYLGIGGSVLVSMAIFFWTIREGPEAQAWIMAPPSVAVLGVSISSLRRLCRYVGILGREERCLRLLEVLALLALLPALAAIAERIEAGKLPEASSDVMLVGSLLSVIALFRARLYFWEAWSGSLKDRVIDEMSVPGEGIYDEDDMPGMDQEIQLAEEALQGRLSL